MNAQNDLDAYTRQLIAERRAKPDDDLLTALIAAEEAGDKLSNDELVMMVNAVIVAGTDTTRNQLGCAVSLLAEHPDQWALLAERPELAGRAVEESMRFFGAVRGTARFASCDIEYRDIVFPAGTFISLDLCEANRQGDHFPEPDRFDITSPAPAFPQLTFGSGIHYCLGAALARAELQEALPLLAQRMPNLRIDGHVTWKPDGVGIFGPAHMPITFDAGLISGSACRRRRSVFRGHQHALVGDHHPVGSRPSPDARRRASGSTRRAHRQIDRPVWSQLSSDLGVTYPNTA